MTETILYGYRLRPQQAAILDYRSGRMSVSAVPGSGKTLTLALLAARLIIEGHVGDEGNVLVVTVQNSAVDNIAQRIRRILVEHKLPPFGYHVSTLHKLASDILRERCDLAGVEEHFAIVDEAESARTMRSAADTWIAGRRAWWQSFLPDVAEARRARVEESWREETERVGREVTKLCKHLRLRPEAAQQMLGTVEGEDAFLRMGLELYALYAQYLRARSGLDFDDLIWRATDALEQDATFLLNLRRRWPYILEDEAQDSSPLQEQILDRLCGATGNWVRVGDPNQAINSTFTAADPRFFRRFAAREDVVGLSLLESGRSARPIIALANHLVRWTCAEHPEPMVRTSAFLPQDILLTSGADPQANPPDEECHIHFHEQAYADMEAEARAVSRWAADYVQRYPKRTVAVLCPTQRLGSMVVEALQQLPARVPFDDLLRSTPQTRSVARALASVLGYLADPTNRGRLAEAYAALAGAGYLASPASQGDIRHRGALLRSAAPHLLLFPHEALSLQEALPPNVEARPGDVEALASFLGLVGRWVRASALSADQLLLTVAQDLFTREDDLAICHAMATSYVGTSQMHPDWRLREYADDLGEVARNHRSLSRLSLADAGYVPQPGRVAVTTMHKAKGLEWDAVYLISVDELEFPATRDDAFRDEPYFMPLRAPAVESRKRLERLAGNAFAPLPGYTPLDEARLEYICERLRLLYVGITRAKRDLSFTWSETRWGRRLRPAAALWVLRNAHRAAREVEA